MWPKHVKENEFNEVVGENVRIFRSSASGVVFASNVRIEAEPEEVFEIELEVIDFGRPEGRRRLSMSRRGMQPRLISNSTARKAGVVDLEAEKCRRLAADLAQGLQGVKAGSIRADRSAAGVIRRQWLGTPDPRSGG